VVRLVAFSNAFCLAMFSTDAPSQRIQAIFSGNITAWEESDRYFSFAFSLGRIVLTPLLPPTPSGCRRDFNVTSLILHLYRKTNLPFPSAPVTESPVRAVKIPTTRPPTPPNCKIIDNMMSQRLHCYLTVTSLLLEVELTFSAFSVDRITCCYC
jgi:hypothetical protein